MAERLGNALYWTATLIAAILAGLALWTMTWPATQGLANHPFQWAALVLAGIIWLFGRLCRYVIAGK
jgi:hypothetical protein